MDRKEAIEVLRKYSPKDAELREALQTLIPELKESEDELFDHRYAQHLVESQRQKSMIQGDSQKIRQEIKSMADSFKQVVFIADSYGNSYIKWDAKSEESVIGLLEQALEYMKARVE